MFRINVNSFILYNASGLPHVPPTTDLQKENDLMMSNLPYSLVSSHNLNRFAFGFGKFEHLSVHVFCSQTLRRK